MWPTKYQLSLNGFRVQPKAMHWSLITLYVSVQYNAVVKKKMFKKRISIEVSQVENMNLVKYKIYKVIYFVI